jgi:hypothetical protein
MQVNFSQSKNPENDNLKKSAPNYLRADEDIKKIAHQIHGRP